MRRIAEKVAGLGGWRRAAVAFAAGALSALAMAPWFAFPVLWLTLPVLVWLLDGVRPAGTGFRAGLVSAAAVGWSFGFGYFVAGLWWLGAAFFVDADTFAWLMPVAVLGLPAFLALFWGLGGALARLVWPSGWARILVVAAAFALAEWLRGHAFGGFPWNSLGYALAPAPVMMQSAALVGLWGLTLAAFMVFAAPAALAEPGVARCRGGRWLVAGVAAVFLAGLAYGTVRLAEGPATPAPGVRLRIVQPAIPQNEKWVEANADAIFGLQVELSWSGPTPASDPVEAFDLIIWPESAFPFYLDERPDALMTIAEMLPERVTLLAGAARKNDNVSYQVFNSVLVINDMGAIVDAYDKVHLVPFGEFLPFQSTLEAIGLRQLTGVSGGFAAGRGRRTMPLPGGPSFGPLICYEIIFPGAAVAPGARPDWLLNLTNDAWYGDTPGPRQHLHQAQVRAVEEGLPLVRSANNGISAIIDAKGNIVASLGLDEVGVVDGDLPPAGPPTVYSRYRDLFFWMAVVTILCSATINHFVRWLPSNRQN